MRKSLHTETEDHKMIDIRISRILNKNTFKGTVVMIKHDNL